MRTIVLALIGMVFGTGCESPEGGGAPSINQHSSDILSNAIIEGRIRQAIRKSEGEFSKEELEKIKIGKSIYHQ